MKKSALRQITALAIWPADMNKNELLSSAEIEVSMSS